MKKSKWQLILVFVALTLLLVPAIAFAQDGEEGEGEEETEFTCNPVAERLAERLEVECEELLALQAEGYGLGEIMKAAYLAEDLSDFGDWRALLEQRETLDIGWGQFKMAQRLAGEDGDAQELLDLKLSGLGWGEIKKIPAIMAVTGEDGETVVTWLQEGREWEEIRAELGLPVGPPPWAGGGNDKTDQGPPAWANNDKTELDQGNSGGPPPWANNDKDKDKSNGND